MVPSRISSRAFVLKLLRIITNLLSKLRADVGTLMCVPLLLATRGVPDECRRRPRPLGMERIRFPVSSLQSRQCTKCFTLNEHCRQSPAAMLDAGASDRRVSFNAQNERLPRGENNTERTCQGLGACRDGSPSLPQGSWRLCNPSGVHGPRATCG